MPFYFDPYVTEMQMQEKIRGLRNENAQQYFKPESSERDTFYEIFFNVCRKYNIDWATASPKEKAFAEEITRVTFEYRKAQIEGRPLESISAAFSA